MWVCEAIKGGLQPQPCYLASFPLDSHQELPKSDLALAALWCKGALICLHTSMKGTKKVIYVHYGCGKQ